MKFSFMLVISVAFCTLVHAGAYMSTSNAEKQEGILASQKKALENAAALIEVQADWHKLIGEMQEDFSGLKQDTESIVNQNTENIRLINEVEQRMRNR